MLKFTSLIFLIGMVSTGAYADSDTLDAAVGGGVGGAIGAAVGNEVGGRDGAMIGGAVGAAAGVAVNTDDDGYEHRDRHHGEVYIDDHHHSGHFCPPGQAKKGNC